ncbi:metal ABC transporter permease [Martelella alba]|uniref:Metal ABC transporter permease n=1 Tax=Martelella alba TaxID=2590451 RepID=A0ABY2SFN6_9HYPH|nr:metal ABC transporter permease [Martelella alba]TKI03166.1 metal ABC transporter permease [Martelella alba]
MSHKFLNVMNILSFLFAAGFFTNQPVYVAMIVGGCTAIVSGVVGVFTVIRGHAFAGHALADVSSAGGSASFLLGINPLLGFVIMAVLGAAGIELIGVQRARERSLATGIVLSAGLGLSALFLYFDMTTHSTTGAAITVMFGSIWTISPSILPLAIGIGISVMLITGLLYRPWLLSSVNPELAKVQGINIRFVSLLHSLALALAVALSAMTVGAILSTALLVGPSAIALQLSKRPGRTILIAVLIGLATVWAGIVLAYDSFYWTPGHGWPVSFFIVMLIFILYIAIVHLPCRFSRQAGRPEYTDIKDIREG